MVIISQRAIKYRGCATRTACFHSLLLGRVKFLVSEFRGRVGQTRLEQYFTSSLILHVKLDGFFDFMEAESFLHNCGEITSV